MVSVFEASSAEEIFERKIRRKVRRNF